MFQELPELPGCGSAHMPVTIVDVQCLPKGGGVSQQSLASLQSVSSVYNVSGIKKVVRLYHVNWTFGPVDRI